MDADTINFENWFNVNAQGLVKTAFLQRGSEIQLDFRLFEVSNQSEVALAFEPVTVGPDEIEAQVHRFANQIVEYYSGFPGPFGTQIAFAAPGPDDSQEVFTMTVGGAGSLGQQQSQPMLGGWRLVCSPPISTTTRTWCGCAATTCRFSAIGPA
jgi:TolB protein